MFLRLVEYEKMLDKDFHVFYTNVIFVICLNQIYFKRFLRRVFISFSPSECADFFNMVLSTGPGGSFSRGLCQCGFSF